MAKKKVKSKAKQPSKSSVAQNISSEVIAAAYSPAAQPVFMKVCRLCESKDGPFLNIFDADKVTAKKIDELMPFGITENDDLPHKICFRCSAKLEELYEFIQKCIKTQESLRSSIGKTGPFLTKTKTRKAWEEKLNKTNMSNDDICDALIKKAMEGIKDIPLPEREDSPPPTKRVTRTALKPETVAFKKDSTSEDDEESDNKLKNVNLAEEKVNTKVPTPKLPASKPHKSNNRNVGAPIQPSASKNTPNETKPSEVKVKNNTLINSLSFDYVEDKLSSDDEKSPRNEEKPPRYEKIVKEKEVEKPFNIMDHISMIKVNGVGVLFQCKLCNRNFLKKEVVESHNCAKNGIPKEIPKTAPIPEPPRVSTVKYIKLDGDLKKPNSWKSYTFENSRSSTDQLITRLGTRDSNKTTENNHTIEKDHRQEESVQSAPKVKPKPRIGPASKTRRLENDSNSGSGQNDSDSHQTQSSTVQSPSVHIPSAPNLNGRFKLVPGPNNIFTLVEDTATSVAENQKSGKKRKSDTESELKTKDRKKDNHDKSKSPDGEDQPKPYPVGLFQTVAQRFCEPPNVVPPATFTTPAMKKQSYTIVQTGNPSKLLISTKAQAPPSEVPKKRPRKTKPEVREDVDAQEPFRVTLEDVAHPKDTGFFTFINVDPLLQPSYVLPTDNIIQESQISTSTAHNAPESSKESKDKDKYTCNMCGETFSREKKLLTHIQSHYAQMDEEDLLRAEKASKKKGRK